MAYSGTLVEREVTGDPVGMELAGERGQVGGEAAILSSGRPRLPCASPGSGEPGDCDPQAPVRGGAPGAARENKALRRQTAVPAPYSAARSKWQRDGTCCTRHSVFNTGHITRFSSHAHRTRERRPEKDRHCSLRQVAARIGLQPAYLSKPLLHHNHRQRPMDRDLRCADADNPNKRTRLCQPWTSLFDYFAAATTFNGSEALGSVTSIGVAWQGAFGFDSPIQPGPVVKLGSFSVREMEERCDISYGTSVS